MYTLCFDQNYPFPTIQLCPNLPLSSVQPLPDLHALLKSVLMVTYEHQYWNPYLLIGSLPKGHIPKENSFSSPSSHQSPIAPQRGVGLCELLPNCTGVVPGLFLCRSIHTVLATLNSLCPWWTWEWRVCCKFPISSWACHTELFPVLSTYLQILFFFIDNRIPLDICLTLSLSVDGKLGCLHFLASVSRRPVIEGRLFVPGCSTPKQSHRNHIIFNTDGQ